MNEAQLLHAELTERMVHVDHLIVGMRSKMGNTGVAFSPSVSSLTIKKIIKILCDELKERKEHGHD